MRKTITAILIIFVVIIFGSFAIRYFANSPEQDNWFNNEYRLKFSRYPFLRFLYGLHWDGDARADFLLPQPYPNINVVFYRYDECNIKPADLEPVRQEIINVTKKPGQVTVNEGSIMVLTKDNYDRQGIRDIAKKFHTAKTGGDTAVLNIYCLNAFSEQPSNVGMTVNEDGIVIFYDTLRQDTGADQAVFTKYLASTILHEFGHQIGLGHGQDPTCLMAESVEISPLLDSRLAAFTPQTFCAEEILLIEENRSSLYNVK